MSIICRRCGDLLAPDDPDGIHAECAEDERDLALRMQLRGRPVEHVTLRGGRL